MSCTDIVKARVSTETKRMLAAAAGRELLTEAAWLKRLVIRELREAQAEGATVRGSGRADGLRPSGARQERGRRRLVFVRLRPEDRLLLDARAEARGMRPATYLSVLARAHLRGQSPLPKEEYLALKRSVGELAAIGRNINQIARAANEGGRLPSSVREEFRAMLKICEGLRDNTKELLKANTTSWSTGHAETGV